MERKRNAGWTMHRKALKTSFVLHAWSSSTKSTIFFQRLSLESNLDAPSLDHIFFPSYRTQFSDGAPSSIVQQQQGESHSETPFYFPLVCLKKERKGEQPKNTDDFEKNDSGQNVTGLLPTLGFENTHLISRTNWTFVLSENTATESFNIFVELRRKTDRQTFPYSLEPLKFKNDSKPKSLAKWLVWILQRYWRIYCTRTRNNRD